MEDLLYKQVRIVKLIEILPKELHKNIMNVITKRIKYFYECKCDPHLGYIKKNSITILKKSEGVLRPNSFTGSFLFKVEFECLAIKPMPDDTFSVIVNKKNESGLYATAFNLPFNIFILKDYVDSEEEKNLIGKIEEKTVLSVTVLRAELNPVQNKYSIVAAIKKIINTHMQEFPIIPIPILDMETCGITITPSKITDFCDTYASIKNCKLLKAEKQNIGVFKTNFKLAIKIKSGKVFPLNKSKFSSSSDITSSDAFQGKKFWGLIKNLIHNYSPLEDFSYSFKKYLVSRAFFKMIEMINIFPDILQNKNMKILNIAESPGGFIQALLYARNVGKIESYSDSYVCISIPENNTELLWDRPDGSGIIQKLQMHGSKKYFGNFIFGIDEVVNIDLEKGQEQEKMSVISFSSHGDVLRDDTLDMLLHKYSLESKVDLITADGAFGYNESEDDYQNQEVRHYSLFIAEIITALSCQNKNGSFILKIFDILTDCSIKLLVILSYCYSTVKLFKPITSRQANSEKYVICINFEMPDNLSQILTKLKHGLHLLKTTELTKDADYLDILFDFDLNDVDNNFIQNIKGYNDKFIENEYLTIKEGLAKGEELLAINTISGINTYIDDANQTKLVDVRRFIKNNKLPDY